VPLFFIVLHRMLPFFTAPVIPQLGAWQPDGALFLIAGDRWHCLLVLQGAVL